MGDSGADSVRIQVGERLRSSLEKFGGSVMLYRL